MRVRRFWRLATAITLAAAIADLSCTLLTSTSGLTGGGSSGASGGDASTSAGDASTTDAPASDAPAGPFCRNLAPAPAFCADFDDGAFDVGWPMKNIPSGSTLSRDESASVSPPASLAATAPAGQASGSGLGPTMRTTDVLGRATTGAHLAFALRLDAADPTTSPQLSALTFRDPASSKEYSVILLARPGSAAVQEDIEPTGGGATKYLKSPLDRAVEIGTWTHVDIDVSFTDRLIVVALDGTEALRQPMDPGGYGGDAKLRIGVVSFGSSTVLAASCHFDDVALTLR